jgi:hypothetical protein
MCRQTVIGIRKNHLMNVVRMNLIQRARKYITNALVQSDSESSFSDSDSSSTSSDDSSSESDCDSIPRPIMSDVMNELVHLHGLHYGTERIRHPKSKEWLYEYTWIEAPCVFRAHFRVTHDLFLHLLRLIQGHEVFQSAHSPPQAPVWVQLITTLFYFGGDSTANLRNRKNSKFAIDNGTVHLYVGRGQCRGHQNTEERLKCTSCSTASRIA